MAIRRHQAVGKPPRRQDSGVGHSPVAEQAWTNPQGGGDDLVFRAKRGGPIRESRFVQRYFRPLLESADLPAIRFYDLRHTAATISLAAGVSPKVISEQLGHASVAFTLDVYSHVLPHMQDMAAEKVQALLMNAAGA
jgi:integrase